MKYDFSGYATRANVRCADGRVILKDAFKGQNGAKVPIVWQHQRNDPDNVLGHGILENRDDGVYVYGLLNDSPRAIRAKALLEHGDITGLSIFANELIEARKQVSHGMIREVSLVIAPANPGAYIENVNIQHGDDTIVDDESAIIYLTDDDDFISHASDDDDSDDSDDPDDEPDTDGKTVKDVYNTLNKDQKKLFFAAMAHAISTAGGSASHSAEEPNTDDEGGKPEMKWNAFEHTGAAKDTPAVTAFSQDDVKAIFKTASKYGSLREATKEYVIQHAAEHGITAVDENSLEHGIEKLDLLFPDAKTLTPTPEMIARQQEWVSRVWNATRKSPFSRIKTMFADITKDEARARGYIKGKKKIEEQFALMKRVTTPQTVYKLQKLDRDDIIDITDFNVVAWLKAEMRMMLNEELARAILVGDGREPGAEDHISYEHIRPVYRDEEMYAIHKLVNITADDDTREEKTDAIIDAVYEAREDYRGSGSPTFYCPSNVVTTMMLARDNIGRRLFNTEAELASALRCRAIEEVPVMDNQVRETGTDSESLPAGYTTQTKYDLIGIMVNLTDYTVGADKGGEVNLFDDFDIDFNKYTYLIETRCSGALYRAKSAIVLEKKHSGE